MANDNFYSNPRKPIPAWASFDAEGMSAGGEMEFKADDSSSSNGEQTGGGGGDIDGNTAFMMLINGTQATDLDPEGQPIPSPVFSFRVKAGTVTFKGEEFENNGPLTETVAAYGPENVEFPTGSNTELKICFCRVTFTRDPDTNKADRKITGIDSAAIEFTSAASVTDSLNMWSGTLSNPEYLFKIGYLSVTQDGPTRRFVYAMILQVGNFIYNSEKLSLELQVIAEEGGTNVVKTLKLKGNLSSAS
tara:strand:+ start:4931 stop:5671 length:741 start_codon:yes stop_codon:yes gene_type:complete